MNYHAWKPSNKSTPFPSRYLAPTEVFLPRQDDDDDDDYYYYHYYYWLEFSLSSYFTNDFQLVVKYL